MLLKDIEYAESVGFMLEIELWIDLFKLPVKDPLSAVSERCMSDIVTQCDRSDKIDIKIQRAAYSGSNIVNINNVLKS